ncbi:MAG: InlB B-repeat-containing protein, partial [Atopobiaceae bacterium]|nr:InlB B-repeat-containing protein [Atopobiaceae bacterium]
VYPEPDGDLNVGTVVAEAEVQLTADGDVTDTDTGAGVVADEVTITAGGNIGSDDNPLDVNADDLTTTSGGDTNLNLTSPSTNVDVTAGGDIDIDATGAVQGKASGTSIDIVADGDIGSPTKPFEATLPNVGDRPTATSNYGGIWVKKLPQEFALTLNLNGGTLDGQTGTITIVLNDGSVFVLPLPTREGYRFLYWLGSIYYAGDEYLVVAGHTFTAVWEKIVDPEPDPKPNGGDSRAQVPQTGDGMATAPIAMLALAGLALMLVGLLRRKEEDAA